ncbi:MAG: DUF1552 domain-containing protein [Polyangiaceae bacterium]
MSRHQVKALKHTGRRAFLRLAGGVALGLPLLELTHGKAWSAGGTARRFITVFSHGGMLMNQDHSGFHSGNDKYLKTDYWKPAANTEALVLGPIMEGLEAIKSKLLVLRGVDNKAASEQAQYGSGGHGISNVTALTCADASDPWGEPDALGPSIDQVMADRLADLYPVKFKRIHLDVSGHQYGSPYYAASGQRVSGENDPKKAFETIFEGVSADEPDPAYEHLQMKRRRVVDGVMESLAQFRGIVGAADQARIDAHLDHLSDLEKELSIAPPLCQPPTGIDAEGNDSNELIGPLHAKIIVAALRCGLTNVANLEIADIVVPWAPSGLQVDSAFEIGHSLGHYAREVGPTGESANIADEWSLEMLENRQWRLSLFQAIAEALDDPAFMEGGNTMLDNSLMVLASEFSDPASHVSSGTPLLLAGSAGNYFKTGRYIDYNIPAQSDPNTLNYQTNESTHNLFTSVLQAFGGDDAHFGSDHAAHQGPLPDLT